MTQVSSSVDHVRGELETINPRSAQLFTQSAGALEAIMSPGELVSWAGICLEIAGSGWHAFESANAYMALSMPMATKQGVSALADCGLYGFRLCGFSFEPSATYFRGIQHLLDEDMLDERQQHLEAAGKTLRESFTHASNLVTDYYRVAFTVANHNSEPETKRWCKLVEEVSILERADVISFLNASEAAAGVNWSFVQTLNLESIAAGIDFLGRYPRLVTLFEVDVLAQLEQTVLTFASDPATLSDWLDKLEVVTAELSPAEMRTVIEVSHGLPLAVLATSLLEVVDRLPLTRPQIIHHWSRQVHDYLPDRIDVACGYLGLESLTSIKALEHLLGQVNFADCKRILQLYTEAIVGRRLSVEPIDKVLPDFRALPSTDGLSIHLPASIAVYPDRRHNFDLYKISLLHQLGYYEFGTFDFAGPDGSPTTAAFRYHFSKYRYPELAAGLFQLLEDARVDWAIARRYRGAESLLARFKQDALENLPPALDSIAGNALLALTYLSLDAGVPPGFPLDCVAALRREITRLDSAHSDVHVTMEVVRACYDIIMTAASAASLDDPESIASADAEAETGKAPIESPMPEPIEFRGRLEPDRVRINMHLAQIEEPEVEFSDTEPDGVSMTSMVDPRDIKIEQLKKGEVQEALGMMITDLDGRGIDEALADKADDNAETFKGLIKSSANDRHELSFQYDEWDTVILDYRRLWCTLYEIRDIDEKPEFVEDTLRELRSVSSSVRKQLSHLRPELLRKIKGMEDGEELDLERAIESRIDQRAGLSPSERIYIQRQRKDRDVSALFLLDMSASTDDRITLPQDETTVAPVSHDHDDFLHDYYGSELVVDDRKRIIELEKEAVVLMADALEDLGDNYAVCGFSGYGRDKVDFYVCKDFTEPYNTRAKGRIGGIKPCRSTRMGPAIRHATRRLNATESRVKALIIISDGYPQDFDYGKDRNSKDYGIKDTTMALTEARQQGVQAFCLTVDPSGHDYLREMCPDQQYMVIQDINQLPDELSKVYRSLTA